MDLVRIANNKRSSVLPRKRSSAAAVKVFNVLSKKMNSFSFISSETSFCLNC